MRKFVWNVGILHLNLNFFCLPVYKDKPLNFIFVQQKTNKYKENCKQNPYFDIVIDIYIFMWMIRLKYYYHSISLQQQQNLFNYSFFKINNNLLNQCNSQCLYSIHCYVNKSDVRLNLILVLLLSWLLSWLSFLFVYLLFTSEFFFMEFIK